MFGVLVLALVIQVGASHVTTVHDLHIEAQTALLRFAAENKAESIVELTRLYRKDLEPDYVAYWQIVTDQGDYLVISSGHKTGEGKVGKTCGKQRDYRIVMEGKIPSPTALLDARARALGNACAKYYMLAPGGILMCEDEVGQISATSHDPFIQSAPVGTDVTFQDRHRFLERSHLELTKHWWNVKHNVSANGVWNTSDFYPRDNKNIFYSKTAIRKANETEEGISMGEKIRIPISAGSVIKVKYTPHTKTDDRQVGQKILCDILKICSGHDLYSVDPTKVTSALGGISFLTIHPRWPGYALGDKEFSFQIESLLPDGRVYVRRFGLDLRKRDRRLSPLSAMAISEESLFPEYDQHMLTERHCYVGCGPVSWAMIFGYFDRRSHSNPKKYGTQPQALWRCGPTGNEGNNSCVAPSRNTATLKHYTEHLNGIMGTFCLGDQGATPQWKMDDVVDYFKARLSGANPTIEAHHDWLLSDVGLYEDKFRTNMIEFIQSGWPTVVGIRVDGVFSQHYPVASRYRQHVTRARTCIAEATPSGTGSCAKWRSATEYDMYLHMGWGGSQNGWRKAGMFFAAAAKYDLPTAA